MPCIKRTNPMAKALPTTVLSLPLVSHLRDESKVNPSEDLLRMDRQAKEAVRGLRIGLLAASGRWPREIPDGEEGFYHDLLAIRSSLGLPEEGSQTAHWIWEYLNDRLTADIALVPLDVFAQVARDNGHEVSQEKTRLQLSKDGTGRSVTGTATAEGEIGVRRNGKDRTLGALWDLAAAVRTIRSPSELMLGDSVPYYLAGWILGVAEPPASFRDALPGHAADLLRLVQSVFPAVRQEADRWTVQAAEKLGRSPADGKVVAAVREALAACCYSALSWTRSWVSLDILAQENRTERRARLDVRLAALPNDGGESVEKLLEAMDARCTAAGDEPLVGPGSLDWRACQAISSFMAGGRWEYQREGQEPSPWTHVDRDAFWDAFAGPHRQALTQLVDLVAPEDETIGEVYRSWTRAQGYAKLPLRAPSRIHIDASNAGISGTLASTVDPTETNRLRGPRGGGGTPVVLASVNWLGQTIPLRFHPGRNRSLHIQEDKTGWSVALARNARQPVEIDRGQVKSWDLSVRGDRIRIDLALQVGLPAYADTSLAKTLAIGGWYHARPGGDPMSGAAKLSPPESARVLALDVGVRPIASFAVVEKKGDRYHQVIAGEMGPLTGAEEVYQPGLILAKTQDEVFRARKALQAARSMMKRGSGHAGDENPHPNTAGARDWIEALEEGDFDPAKVRTATTTLIQSVPEAAAGPASRSARLMVGPVQMMGRGEALEPLAGLVDRLIAHSLAAAGIHGPTRRLIGDLMTPLATVLLAYQRQRVAGHDIASISKKSGLTDAQVSRQRDAVALLHGYRSEAHYWHLVHLGSTSIASLEKSSQDAQDRALSCALQVADLLENTSDLGKALTGWGLPPLARGKSLPEDDDRTIWEAFYGHLRTSAANMRTNAHQVVAARAVRLAHQHGCQAIVTEHLDNPMTSRQDRQSNTLSRRMATADWMAMIRRAAEVRGLPLVLVDSYYSSTEVIHLDENGHLLGSSVALRRGPALVNLQGASLGSVRLNAARTLALRALSGNIARPSAPVHAYAQPDGTWLAVLRQAPDGRWSAWQVRLAGSLGGTPDTLAWSVTAAGDATIAPRSPQAKGEGASRMTLLAAGPGRWITLTAYAALERQERIAQKRKAQS